MLPVALMSTGDVRLLSFNTPGAIFVTPDIVRLKEGDNLKIPNTVIARNVRLTSMDYFQYFLWMLRYRLMKYCTKCSSSFRSAW